VRFVHAVVFDIDGTILQSAAVDDELYRRAVFSVLGHVQFRPSLADYDYVSDSGILAQILADNALDDDAELVGAVKAHFVSGLTAHIAANGPFEEIPGAKRTLETLNRSANHSVAIATGGWRESALLKLQTAGFGELDVPVATSDDARDRKEIMRVALSHLGSNFSSVTYFGDGPWDRDATIELGWRFVAVGSVLGGLASYDELNDV